MADVAFCTAAYFWVLYLRFYATPVVSNLVGGIYYPYRGLWKIEETFKITKGTLEARPVYVSREDRVSAHFLTYFNALVMIRLIQKLTDIRYSEEIIIECLNKISCSYEHDNLYLFNYRNDLSDAIGTALDIDSTRKRLQLSKIINILANSKK